MPLFFEDMYWLYRIILLGAIFGLMRGYYHHSTAADLDWLLRPTTLAVSAWTNQAFHHQPAVGYVLGADVLINKGCSGFQYLLLLSLMTAWVMSGRARARSGCGRVADAVLWGGAIYLLTIVVNAARITSFILLKPYLLDYEAYISLAQAHEVQGNLIYFTSLAAYYLALQYYPTASLPIPLLSNLSMHKPPTQRR